MSASRSMRVIFRNIVAGAFLFNAAFPTAFAARATDRLFAQEGEGGGARAQIFCNRLNATAARLSTLRSEREAKLEEVRSARDARIAERRAERDAARTAKRSEWDKRRAEHYAKLSERATTDAQRAAVEEFQKTVEAAVAARRAAVDAAVLDFRNGVKDAIAARRTSVDAAIARLRTSIENAIAKAKEDCAAGVDPFTVRETLITSIKQARDQYQQDLGEAEKIGETVRKLAETKHAAVKAAVEQFRATLEEARAKLKAAFATSPETPTPEPPEPGE